MMIITHSITFSAGVILGMTLTLLAILGLIRSVWPGPRKHTVREALPISVPEEPDLEERFEAYEALRDEVEEKEALQPKKELPDHVIEAFKDWLHLRLLQSGEKELKFRDELIAFAQWHGVENLNRGILRPLGPVPAEEFQEEIPEDLLPWETDERIH